MKFQGKTIRHVGLGALCLATLIGFLILVACSSSRNSHIAYVVGGSSSIAAFRIDDTSGSATQILASPFTTGKAPSSLAVHPANKLLYVANQGENTISRFKIDSTSGVLTEEIGRTITGISPIAITMDGGGSFLYVANQGSNNVSVFSIASDGGLSEAAGSPYAVASSPSGLTLRDRKSKRLNSSN